MKNEQLDKLFVLNQIRNLDKISIFRYVKKRENHR